MIKAVKRRSTLSVKQREKSAGVRLHEQIGEGSLGAADPTFVQVGSAGKPAVTRAKT